MANVFYLPSFYLIAAVLIVFSSAAVSTASSQSLRWVRDGARCHGSVAECMMEDIEFEMDSEINRRILATSKYISYEALKANSVPCSRRGASYYNCQPGAEANPYDRGCSAIARCRS